MGKGGDSQQTASAGDTPAAASWFGLGSLTGAVQTITGSKWAEGAMKARAPRSEAQELKYRSHPILWEEVRKHSTVDSCWIVVKSKVSMLALFDCETSILRCHGQDSYVAGV
jgi:hypothetical protein